VLAAAAFAGVPLFRIVRTEHGLPLWDEAAGRSDCWRSASAPGAERGWPDPRRICTSPSGGLAGILSMPAVSLVAR